MAASCWSLYCYCWLHTHIQINIAGRRRCCCCRWLLQQQKRQVARLLFSNFPTNKKSSWCGDWTPFFCLLVCWKLTNNCLVFHVVVYLKWWNWFLTLGLTPFWPLLLQFRNRVCAHNNFHSKVQLFLWFSTNTRTQPHKTTLTLPTAHMESHRHPRHRLITGTNCKFCLPRFFFLFFLVCPLADSKSALYLQLFLVCTALTCQLFSFTDPLLVWTHKVQISSTRNPPTFPQTSNFEKCVETVKKK